jgi:hypothetical protein
MMECEAFLMVELGESFQLWFSSRVLQAKFSLLCAFFLSSSAVSCFSTVRWVQPKKLFSLPPSNLFNITKQLKVKTKIKLLDMTALNEAISRTGRKEMKWGKNKLPIITVCLSSNNSKLNFAFHMKFTFANSKYCLSFCWCNYLLKRLSFSVSLPYSRFRRCPSTSITARRDEIIARNAWNWCGNLLKVSRGNKSSI